MHDKLAYIIKHNRLVQLVYRIVVSACIRFIGVFVKTDEKLVLLSSYGGKQYSDSPRVLFEAMQKDERFKKFHYVWAFEETKDFNIHNAKSIKIDSLQYFITALKAKIWITNVNIERGLHFKKRETVYLNTWHGTGPKKGGNAVKGRSDYDFSNVDIFCCDGVYTHDVFQKWWNAKEESMLWCGRPREDELFMFTEADKLRIRKALQIPQEKKIILYMPTWREYGSQEINLWAWKEMLEEKYVLCMRAHHFSRKDALVEDKNLFVYDVTAYSNVNELYCIADILISDYSSAFFDFGLLGKPIYCYAYDYERYRDTYGLFMDLEHEFPNGIMRTEQQLLDAIVNMDYEEECKKSSTYINGYVKHPVNATQCCINEIYKKLKLENKK